MFRLIHLIALAMGIVTFVVNILFGFYVTVLKLALLQFVPLLISSALLSVWILISFVVYFLVGIARFSSSQAILVELTPSLIILAYMVIGLVVFWSFKVIDFRP